MRTFLENYEQGRNVIFTWLFVLNVDSLLLMQNSEMSFILSHSNLEDIPWPRPWAWDTIPTLVIFVE